MQVGWPCCLPVVSGPTPPRARCPRGVIDTLDDRPRFCNTAGSKESRFAHRSTSVDDPAVVTEGGHAQRLSPPKIGSPRASRKESFGSEAPDVRDRPSASPPGVASAAPGGHEGA